MLFEKAIPELEALIGRILRSPSPDDPKAEEAGEIFALTAFCPRITGREREKIIQACGMKGWLALFPQDEASACLKRMLKTLDILAKSSSCDPLTALPDRSAFEKRLALEAGRAETTDAPIAVALISIDDFERLIDESGPEFAEEVIVRLARTLNENKRIFDFAARMDKALFALIMPELGHARAFAGMELLAQKVAMERFKAAKGRKGVKITCSIGLASVKGKDGLSPADLLKLAEKALTKAMGKGRNCVVDVPFSPRGPSVDDPSQVHAQEKMFLFGIMK